MSDFQRLTPAAYSFLIAIFVSLVPCIVVADTAAEEFGKVLINVLEYEVVPVLSFTEEQRKQILEHGWEQANRESIIDNSWHLLALAVIGDPAAHSAIVRKIVEDPASSIARSVAATGDPKFLPDLAPAIFTEEEYRVYGGDAKWFPKSFVVASLITKLVSRSPHFSDEVINWGHRFDDRSLSDQESMVEMREIVRAWWKANGHLVKSGEFAAVQPGANPSKMEDPPILLGTVPLSAQHSQQGSLEDGTSATPAPEHSTGRAIVSPTVGGDVEHFPRRSTWIGGGVAGLLVILILWVRKRRLY